MKSPTKKTQQHPTPSPSELSSFTSSQIYPKLELQRVHSTTTSSLTDLYHKDKDSDSTASTRVTDIVLAQDTDLVLNHKETPSNDIIIHIDLHQNLKILDQDLEHPQETDNKTE